MTSRCGFVASAAASIITGWSEPVPGRDFPLKSSLSRRTVTSIDDTFRGADDLLSGFVFEQGRLAVGDSHEVTDIFASVTLLDSLGKR